MNTFLTVNFNSTTWDSHGLNWLRKAKSCLVQNNRYSCFVLADSIGETAESKIKEFGFKIVPYESKNKDDRDFIKPMIDCLSDLNSKVCVYTRPNVSQIILPSINDEDIFAVPSEINLYNIVGGIKNLHNRVSALNLIKEKMGDKMLSSALIAGTHDFWILYLGFLNLIQEANYIDYYDSNCTLNLFCSLFDSFKVGTPND